MSCSHRSSYRQSIAIILTLATLGLSSCKSLGQPFNPQSSSPTPQTLASSCGMEQTKLMYEIESQADAPNQSKHLEAVAAVLRSRLKSLNPSKFEVKPLPSGQIAVNFSGDLSAETATSVLGQPGKISFRPQKRGTGPQVSVTQGRLHIEKIKLMALEEKGDPAGIEAQQTVVDQLHQEMIQFFDESDLKGNTIKDAFGQPSQNSASWVVVLRFDAEGSQKFAKLTREVAGTGQTLGIFVDGELLSSPTVSAQFSKTGITGGSAEITGGFTAENSYELAIQLRSGELPADIKLTGQESKSKACLLRPPLSVVS